MALTLSTFKSTRGYLQAYGDASAVLKVMALDETVIDNEDELVVKITDIDASEVTGGTYAATELTGVEWDLTGLLPALRADDVLIEGLDCPGPTGLPRYYAVYVDDHDVTDRIGDLVSILETTPVAVVGDQPIQWPSGIIATVEEGDAVEGTGIVETIVAGDNITVDDTDPANPIVSATGGGSAPDTTGAAPYDVYTVTTPGDPAEFRPELFEAITDISAVLDTTGQTTGYVLSVPASPGDPAEWAAPPSGGLDTTKDYYRGTGYHFPNGRVGSNMSLTRNATIMFPFRISNTKTAIGISLYISAGGGTGSLTRLGIYNSDATTGQPTTLLVDGGTVASSSTGALEATISQSLTPGVYWIAANPTGGTGDPAAGALDASGDPLIIDTSHGVNQAGAYQDVTANSASGALPATFTISNRRGGLTPRLGVRF